MIRNEIKKFIQKALRDLQKSGVLASGKLPEVKVEYPADPKMGDYATNVAFMLASAAKKSPQETARLIAEKILSDKNPQKMFDKVEAAGAGFVNFSLSKEFLQKQLKDVGGPTLHINVGKNKKLNIEFLSANPTGKFQVGNGRGGFYGDVLGNIFTLAGYKVTKEYYINNAKSSNQIQELGKTALGKGQKYLTPYVQEKIKALKGKFINVTGSDPVTFAEAGFLLAKEIQKDNKAFLEKIGIHYDAWTEEEEDLVKSGLIKKTLAYLAKKGLVYEKDGAQWLKTTEFGDDKDKVLVRSNGEYGYYLADIAYHRDKIKRGFGIIIDIWGADHQGHVMPMKVAMQIMGFKGKFEVLISQLVQAKGGGKFSKRAGNVILLEELIREVGVDAARFFYLMKSLDTQMEFDMDLAKEQSAKNPVYYVQYAHARMASILRKARSTRFAKASARRAKSEIKSSKLLKHESELRLIKQLLRWPEVVVDTASDYQVQRVTGYATELATAFNQFYRDCKVICDDKNLMQARVGLVGATQTVLQEVLGTLGVSAPDKM